MIGRKELESIKRVKNHAEVKFKDGTQLEAEMLLYAWEEKPMSNISILKSWDCGR